MHLSTLRLHRAPLTSRAMRISLLLFGVLGLTLIASQLSSNYTANAASWLRYQRGYSVQGSWLCYGWGNGAYHCTHHWHRNAAGHLISDNHAWVPNYGAAATVAVTRQPATSHAAAPQHAPQHAPIIQRAPVVQHPAPVVSGNLGQQGVINEIRAVFGPYAGQALAVARCESGYNAYAVNRSSDAEGVFQFLRSTWVGTSYAGYSRFNASANIHAAYQVFSRDGHSWREWSCQP